MNTKNGNEKLEERIKDLSKEATAEVSEKARQMAVDGVASVAADSRNVAARYVQSLGTAAHAAANSLEADGYGMTANPISRAATMADGMSESLQSYDVRSMADEVIGVARRNPALSFGLAAFAGYMLVKFSQSQTSSTNRSD